MFCVVFDKIDKLILLFNIGGERVRLLLGMHAFLLGVAYMMLWFANNPAARIVLFQAEIMPLWAYSIMFMTLGFLMLATRGKRRLTLMGRNIAIIGISVYTLYTLTFLTFGTYTTLLTYPIFIYAYFCEAFSTY